MKPRLFWIGGFLIALVIFVAVLVWRAHPHELAASALRRGAAVELVYATGFVETDQPVSVAARITAPVVRVLADEGDHVRRGQRLLVLEDDEQRGSLAQAAAQRRSAAQDEARALKLYAQGWATRASRDQAVAAADTTRAAEQSAAARLNQLVVRAGIDGIVLKRDVEPGDLAVPTRTLMLLGDPTRTRVTAAVDERDVPRIRVGQEALMSSDAWPGRVIRGHVREITPGGDPDQRAFRIRLHVDEAVALPIGLTLEVNVVTRQIRQALLAPASAVLQGSVWVIENGRLHRREVRTGIVAVQEVQIVSGLREGDLLVRHPTANLKEGDRARPNLK
jgi:RND family efflux transporter MFP subunit